MTLRGHEPLPIDDFNGLWGRGDADSCPPGFWTDCANMEFSQSSAFSRFPFAREYSCNIGMMRQQIFVTKVAGVQTVFIMGMDFGGNFYKQQISPTPGDANPVLLNAAGANSILDFDLVSINGIAFITFSQATVGLSSLGSPAFGTNVYLYNGTTFRQAGGIRPGAATIAVSAGGAGDPGWHMMGVAFEYDTGFVGPIQPTSAALSTGLGYNLSAIPVGGGGTGCIARRIYSTKIIPNGFVDPLAQKYYYVGRINDNVTTVFNNTTFFDNQLLQDDTKLLTIISNPPSGIGISKYHNRMIIWGFPTMTLNINTVPTPAVTVNLTPSTILISNVNNPESFDPVDGLILIDPNVLNSITDADGFNREIGLTDCQEYRDILYCCKMTKTYALSDNGDVPATWPLSVVDEGAGSFIKGIATVLDSGGVNYEYLVIANLTGMYLFTGTFNRPELTYNIADLWKLIYTVPAGLFTATSQAKNHFVLDTINKKIYFNTTITPAINVNTILVADFANVTNLADMSKTIRWSKWFFTTTPPFFFAFTLFGWDTGSGFKLFTYDFFGNAIASYNGSGAVKENMAPSFFQTHLIANDEESLIHIGAIRFRIAGNNPSLVTNKINVTVFNEDGTRSQVLVPFQIFQNMGTQPTILANFIAQKFYIKVSTNPNGYFNLNKMIPFVKPVYSGGRG